MALEGVVYPQDPLLSYYYCKDQFFYGTLGSGSWNHEPQFSGKPPYIDEDGQFPHNPPTTASPLSILQEWSGRDRHYPYPNSSPETCAGIQPFVGPVDQVATIYPAPAAAGDGGRRKRRSVKNKEEVENQRMTHIAVERNRRRQMNEYLSVIRTLMPPSYVQRGDQASIIGGAINYVKELEQRLHSLETHKRIKQEEHPDDIDLDAAAAAATAPPTPGAPRPQLPLFADFFAFPQFSARSSLSNSNPSSVDNNYEEDGDNYAENYTASPTAANYSGASEIEVTLVDGHANVKILTKRRQSKQILKLVESFHSIRFSVLHLNVTATTVDDIVLYSFSLKVEEGSRLNSVEEIADATNQIQDQSSLV